MKKIFPAIVLLFSCSTNSNRPKTAVSMADTIISNNEQKNISDSTNALSGKTQTLELERIFLGRSCEDWITPYDFERYRPHKLAKYCIFIEPESTNLEIPLYYSPDRHTIIVTGQFYVKADYPKGMTQIDELIDKAKVFRYTKIEIKKRKIDYPEKDNETFNLSYNAIACTCAQWCETDSIMDTSKVEFAYLEPANNNLINADSLYKGDNLPIQIKVTGQIISISGYPTGFKPIKGNPDPAIVFRYTKIKVLKNGRKKNGN